MTINTVTSVTRNLYYPNAIPFETTDEKRIAFERHPLYPVVLEYSHVFNMSVVSVRIDSRNSAEVIMARQDGFNGLILEGFQVPDKNEGKPFFRVRHYSLPFSFLADTVANSTKTKYMIDKSRRWMERHGVMSTNEVIKEVLNNLKERIRMNSRHDDDFHFGYRFKDDSATVKAMVESLLGKVALVPDMHMAKINEIYKQYSLKEAEKETTKKDLQSLMFGTKYLIGTPSVLSIEKSGDMNCRRSGLVFGVIKLNDQALSRALSQPSSPNEIETIEPIKWYPTLNHLPEKYIDEVKAKLTFARAANQDSDTSRTVRDSERLLPPSYECVWDRDLNMANWRSGYGSSFYQFIMFDKFGA